MGKIFNKVKDRVADYLLSLQTPKKEPEHFIKKGYDVEVKYKTICFIEAAGIIVKEIVEDGQVPAYPIDIHMVNKETLTLQFEMYDIICEVKCRIPSPRTMYDDLWDSADIVTKLAEIAKTQQVSKTLLKSATALHMRLAATYKREEEQYDD